MDKPYDSATALCRPQFQLTPSECLDGDSFDNVTGWTYLPGSGKCSPINYKGCGMRWKYFGTSHECQEGLLTYMVQNH